MGASCLFARYSCNSLQYEELNLSKSFWPISISSLSFVALIWVISISNKSAEEDCLISLIYLFFVEKKKLCSQNVYCCPFVCFCFKTKKYFLSMIFFRNFKPETEIFAPSYCWKFPINVYILLLLWELVFILLSYSFQTLS